MRAFRFSLEHVVCYRRNQAEMERMHLRAIQRQMDALLFEQDSLRCQTAAARMSVAEGAALTGGDLLTVSRFLEFANRRQTALAAARKEVQIRLEAQRQRVAEADRQVRLLERLKERRRTEWQALADRELDELAADSFRAKLASNRAAARRAGDGQPG